MQARRAPVPRVVPWQAIACLVFSAFAAGIAPAAHAQLFTDTESRKAIAAQRETIAAQQQQIADLARQAGELSARINQLENALKAQSLLEVLNQVEALQAEMRTLRGQQEVLANSIETATRRQRDMYIDLDSRLKRLETTAPAAGTAPAVPGAPALAAPAPTVAPTGAAGPGGTAPASGAGVNALSGAAPASPAVPAGAVNSSTAGRGPIVAAPAVQVQVPPAGGAGTPAAGAAAGGATAAGITAAAVAGGAGSAVPGAANSVASPAAAVDPVAEQRAYDAAHQLRRNGNYAGAITAFQSFVKTYPKSRLAPAAQYWVGDSHFNLREFRVAIASQRQLLATWPDNEKAPDAMLNIASSQAELGEAAAARKTLEELVARHPLSEAAERAKRRLAPWK